MFARRQQTRWWLEESSFFFRAGSKAHVLIGSAEMKQEYEGHLRKIEAESRERIQAAVAEGQRVDAIAAQAIAFARLAGFLAGQLPPEADLYRTALEAFGDGHAEPRRLAEERHAAHAHHGHDHHH